MDKHVPYASEFRDEHVAHVVTDAMSFSDAHRSIDLNVNIDEIFDA